MQISYYARYEELMRETTDSIWYIDLEERLLDVSLKKARNHGFEDRHAMIGHLFGEFMTVEEANWVRELLAEIIITKEKVSDKIQQLQRRGETIWYSVSISPWFDEHGSLIGFMGISRDISKRIRIEERLKDFFTTAIHKIKSPLTSYNGFLRRVAKGKYGELPDNAQATLENLITGFSLIEGECDKLVVNMHALGLGEKSLTDKKTEVDVGTDILLPILNKYELAMEEKGMRIDNRMHSIPPGEVLLKTNAQILSAIFEDLISNAVKYGRVGGMIAVGYRIVPEQGIIFNVFNDGDPLSDEFVEEGLFKKFQRDNSVEEGTGIGLHSVKESVKMLDGKAWYEKTAGGFPNFLFCLPFSDLIEH